MCKVVEYVDMRLTYVLDLGLSTIRKLANGVGQRAIATFRSRGQGGASGVDPPQRTTVLREICRSRFAYVDLELETHREQLGSLGRLASAHRTSAIVSHHCAQPPEAPPVSDAPDPRSALGEPTK